MYELEETLSISQPSSTAMMKHNVRDPSRKKGKRKLTKDKALLTSKTHACSFYHEEGHSKNTCQRLKLQLQTPSMSTSSYEDDQIFSAEHMQAITENDEWVSWTSIIAYFVYIV